MLTAYSVDKTCDKEIFVANEGELGSESDDISSFSEMKEQDYILVFPPIIEGRIYE